MSYLQRRYIDTLSTDVSGSDHGTPYQTKPVPAAVKSTTAHRNPGLQKDYAGSFELGNK